jgi:hypothetical protein
MMRIEVTTAGVRGRSLWYRSGSTRTFAQYRTDSDEVPMRQDFSREELVGNAQRIAVQWAARFFRRFGYQPPIEAIRNIQGRTWFGGELPADH